MIYAPSTTQTMKNAIYKTKEQVLVFCHKFQIILSEPRLDMPEDLSHILLTEVCRTGAHFLQCTTEL